MGPNEGLTPEDSKNPYPYEDNVVELQRSSE